MEKPLFVHQVLFEVVPTKIEAWRAYMPGYLGAMARLPGSVSLRILSDNLKANRFLLIRVWQTKRHFKEAAAMPESILAEEPGKSEGFYHNMVVEHEELETLDMVWGCHGSTDFTTSGIAVQHIVTGPATGKYQLWRPYARNFASVMARQPNLICHETYRSLNDPDLIIVLRTFRTVEASQAGPEYEPPDEVLMATKPAHDREVYKGHKPARRIECTLLDGLWGTEGQAPYDEFINSLEPV